MNFLLKTVYTFMTLKIALFSSFRGEKAGCEGRTEQTLPLSLCFHPVQNNRYFHCFHCGRFLLLLLLLLLLLFCCCCVSDSVVLSLFFILTQCMELFYSFRALALIHAGELDWIHIPSIVLWSIVVTQISPIASEPKSNN